jgi:hypothetical protein
VGRQAALIDEQLAADLADISLQTLLFLPASPAGQSGDRP